MQTNELEKHEQTTDVAQPKKFLFVCFFAPDEFNREMSPGHFVRMYMFKKKESSMCEWSHGHEESEWSLMTSLIRLFCCP